MSKDPAFPLYAQDFLTGVMYMTDSEIGQYIKLLCKQWTDGEIPKKRVGFLIGCQWEEVGEELKSKFIENGESLINKRLEEERQKRANFRKKQSENGKKGGRPKKNKPNTKPNNNQKKPLENENDFEKEIKNQLLKTVSQIFSIPEYGQKVEDLRRMSRLPEEDFKFRINQFHLKMIKEGTYFNPKDNNSINGLFAGALMYLNNWSYNEKKKQKEVATTVDDYSQFENK